MLFACVFGEEGGRGGVLQDSFLLAGGYLGFGDVEGKHNNTLFEEALSHGQRHQADQAGGISYWGKDALSMDTPVPFATLHSQRQPVKGRG